MNQIYPNRLSGRDALAAQVGERFSADWKSDYHRARRLVSELIGTSGLTFVLSGGAAILAAYGGAALAPFQFAFILSAVSALWLVAAVYFLGDISAHFNPAMTLAFTLRGDMGYPLPWRDLRRRANADSVCFHKLEITLPSNFNHSRYATLRVAGGL